VTVEVIGVVADAPYSKLDDPRPFVVFRPILQEPRAGAVSDGLRPRERRPRDGARWLRARREDAGASLRCAAFITSSAWGQQMRC
jgi:hypothetical protein